MAGYPSPVTEETFSEVWNYTARKLYWARKKAALRIITDAVSQFLFFPVFLVLGYGVLYEMCGTLIHQVFDNIPEFAALWEAFSTALFHGTASEGERLWRCGLLLYGPAITASLAAALLVLLLYHPRSPIPGSDPQENAWQLWEMANQGVACASKKAHFFRDAFCAIAMVLAVVVIIACILLRNQYLPFVAEETGLQNPNLMMPVALAAFLFPLYRLLVLPMELVLLPLHLCRFPAALAEDTEDYFYQLHPRYIF